MKKLKDSQLQDIEELSEKHKQPQRLVTSPPTKQQIIQLFRTETKSKEPEVKKPELATNKQIIELLKELILAVEQINIEQKLLAEETADAKIKKLQEEQEHISQYSVLMDKEIELLQSKKESINKELVGIDEAIEQYKSKNEENLNSKTLSLKIELIKQHILQAIESFDKSSGELKPELKPNENRLLANLDSIMKLHEPKNMHSEMLDIVREFEVNNASHNKQSEYILQYLLRNEQYPDDLINQKGGNSGLNEKQSVKEKFEFIMGFFDLYSKYSKSQEFTKYISDFYNIISDEKDENPTGLERALILIRLSRTLSLLEKSQEELNPGQKKLLTNLDSIMELQYSFNGYESITKFLGEAKKTIKNKNKNYFQTFEEKISAYMKDLGKLARDDSKSPDDRGDSQFKILKLKMFRFAFEEYSKFQEAEEYTSNLLNTLYDITDETITSDDHTHGVLNG